MRWNSQEVLMRPIRLNALGPESLAELDHAYRSSPNARLRIRALMVLLAAEQGLVAAQIAPLVRLDEETVRRWLRRYQAEGLEGLADWPRCGAPPKVTAEYRKQLLSVVRRRPRSLGLPFSLWTADRLADHLAEETGIRLSPRSIYRLLQAGGIRLSRPQHTITSPDPEYLLKKKRSSRSATT
jgi:transposase